MVKLASCTGPKCYTVATDLLCWATTWPCRHDSANSLRVVRRASRKEMVSRRIWLKRRWTPCWTLPGSGYRNRWSTNWRMRCAVGVGVPDAASATSVRPSACSCRAEAHQISADEWVGREVVHVPRSACHADDRRIQVDEETVAGKSRPGRSRAQYSCPGSSVCPLEPADQGTEVAVRISKLRLLGANPEFDQAPRRTQVTGPIDGGHSLGAP
jgi:hypothetical protein